MNRILFPILTAAVLAVGCTKTNEVADPAANPETRSGAVQEPLTFSDATLSFASMEEMNAAAREAVSMTAEEREQMYAANPEFVSMNQAGAMIIEQMREIGTKEGILAMRDAYTDLFIFDPNTVEVRVAPLFKTSNPCHHLVCNAYGDVTIGGAIVNLNDITTYEQTWVGKAEKQILSTRAGARGTVNSFELCSNSNTFRLVVTGASMNAPYGIEPYMVLKSELKYDGVWYPSDDVCTISYVDGLTNNATIKNFAVGSPFSSLVRPGTSFTRTTTYPEYNDCLVIGTTKFPYFLTGYNVASKWSGGKSNNLLLQN